MEVKVFRQKSRLQYRLKRASLLPILLPSFGVFVTTTDNGSCVLTELYFIDLVTVYNRSDRLCGLVVRVSGYRYRGPGFDSRRYQIF